MSTLAFIAVAVLVVADTAYRYPVNSAIGLGILLAGGPVYLLWDAGRRRRAAVAPR